jgi:hypothetical protein
VSRHGDRKPDASIVVRPNESILATGSLDHHLGELAQRLLESGAEFGVSVEIDTSERTKPGESRGGASPIEGVTLVLLGLAGRELGRFADRIFDAVLDWVLRHREPRHEEIAITIYGPNDEVLRTVYVDVDGKTVNRDG